MAEYGALFDLDGVLIDSEGQYTDFWAEMGRKYRLPSSTFAYDIKGCTLRDILDRYFPDNEVREMLIEEIHRFEDQINYPIFPGVIEFLADLRENGVSTAIVTSSDDLKMSCLFSQHPDFALYFDQIVTGSMVKVSKPDPEGYLLAASNLALSPEDCIVFEDSFQGLEAGRRSGAKVVALATTNSRESLKGKACEVIDGFTGFSYGEFKKIVSRL